MDSWGEVDDALRDVTNNPDELVADSHNDHEQTSDEEHKPARNPREAGWSEPVPFSYENFNNKDFTDWASTAARYEWKDEYGDIGPRNENLEKQLFGGEYMSRVGVRFEELKHSGKEEPYSVSIESQFKLQPIATFDDGGIHPVLRGNLELCLYTWPTAIQCYTIPALYEGRDVIGIAQTGSGKTGAFLIPILSKLMGKAKKLAAPRPNIAEGWNPKQHAVTAEPLVLIVCPTRELANQIFDDARRLCYRSMLRPCVVYGGAPAALQREELQKGCDILIGTPGRILDFMSQPRVLSLRRVRYTVIDEADELLQADWEADFKKLMAGGDLNEDSDHRYLMFSASFNKECRKLASNYLSKDHVRIRISRPGSVVRHIQQRVTWVDKHRKKEALYDLLMTLQPTRTLVFVNSKRDVDFVDDYLFNQGLPTTSMHGDRLQQEREDAIRSFRTAQCPIMITTGVSARGLDIVNVMHVINYDLPTASQGGITEYMHRIGRTARIGNEGLATSFYNERDEELAPDLVKLLMESNQVIPEFLESFRPSEATLSFDDDSTDSEAEDAKEDETRAWAPDGDNDKAGDPRWGQDGATDVSAYDELAEQESAEEEPVVRQSGYIMDKKYVAW